MVDSGCGLRRLSIGKPRPEELFRQRLVTVSEAQPASENKDDREKWGLVAGNISQFDESRQDLAGIPKVVKTNRKEGSDATRRNGSLVGTGRVGRCPCDCDPHVMLDGEMLIAIRGYLMVLRRLRSRMGTEREIVPHDIRRVKRTVVKYDLLRNTHRRGF